MLLCHGAHEEAREASFATNGAALGGEGVGVVACVGEGRDTAGGAGHEDACALALWAFRGTLVLTTALRKRAPGALARLDGRLGGRPVPAFVESVAAQRHSLRM